MLTGFIKIIKIHAFAIYNIINTTIDIRFGPIHVAQLITEVNVLNNEKKES